MVPDKEEICESLLEPENILLLEDIIKDMAPEYNRQQRMLRNKTINRGKPLQDSLESVLWDVKQEVDDFLDYHAGGRPTIDYIKFISRDTLIVAGWYGLAICLTSLCQTMTQNFGLLGMPFVIVTPFVLFKALRTTYNLFTPHYKIDVSEIKVKSNTPKAVQIPIIAHEYTHHLLKQRPHLPVYEKNIIFHEGFARGVERHVAGAFSERERDIAYVAYANHKAMKEWLSCYAWMCKKTGSRQKIRKKVGRISSFKPNVHALGNTYLALLEHKHGEEVYEEIFQGEFEF